VDPTPLLAVSFPLFFGLILGDAGYGILILVAGWAVRRRWRQQLLGRDLGFLLVAVGAASVLFGFVYGEVFGDLGHRLGLRPLWGDRLRGATAMLVLTVSIGAAHVILGSLLGAFQALRARLAGRAAGHLANVTALLALFGLLAALAQVLPRSSWRAWAVVLAIAVALLVYLEGAVALVELISTLGNILSYARLMALGMASAALAVVANQLGGITGNVILGAIVALLLHALNLVLGLFSPTVQSLRLHYVEFLPRFYQYGGRLYRPFQKGDVP
jgi:V/A-type H+-transporting ATPase subunit I